MSVQVYPLRQSADAGPRTGRFHRRANLDNSDARVVNRAVAQAKEGDQDALASSTSVTRTTCSAT